MDILMGWAVLIALGWAGANVVRFIGYCVQIIRGEN